MTISPRASFVLLAPTLLMCWFAVYAAPASQPEPSPADKTQAALDKKIPAFELNGEQIGPVLERFAGTAGIKINPQWEELKTGGLPPETLVHSKAKGVRGKRLLQMILDAAAKSANVTDPMKQAVFEVLDDGRVLITSRQMMYTKYASEQRYELGNLLNALDATDARNRMDAVAKLVEETVDPSSWAKERCGPVKCNGTALIVMQTEENQRAVAALLKKTLGYNAGN
jgi:hypothetical protein